LFTLGIILKFISNKELSKYNARGIIFEIERPKNVPEGMERVKKEKKPKPVD